MLKNILYSKRMGHLKFVFIVKKLLQMISFLAEEDVNYIKYETIKYGQNDVDNSQNVQEIELN